MGLLPVIIRGSLRTLVFLLFGLLVVSACQENLVEPVYFGTVTGTVLDARTNLPIANATITTNPATSSYVTTAAGKFQIENVPAGRLAITVSKADYTQLVANVTVMDQQTADVSVVLSKTAVSSNTLGIPVQKSSANQATGQPTDVVLKWRLPAGAAASDSLRYDVLLFESNNLNQRTILSSSKDTVVTASALLYSTTYYWQMIARNPAGASTRSPVWSFQTAPMRSCW